MDRDGCIAMPDVITQSMVTPRADVEEGKARLQAMLREGRQAPIQVEKRYPGAGYLRMIFGDGILTIERFNEEGQIHRRHTEVIVPAAGVQSRPN